MMRGKWKSSSLIYIATWSNTVCHHLGLGSPPTNLSQLVNNLTLLSKFGELQLTQKHTDIVQSAAELYLNVHPKAHFYQKQTDHNTFFYAQYIVLHATYGSVFIATQGHMQHSLPFQCSETGQQCHHKLVLAVASAAACDLLSECTTSGIWVSFLQHSSALQHQLVLQQWMKWRRR